MMAQLAEEGKVTLDDVRQLEKTERVSLEGSLAASADRLNKRLQASPPGAIVDRRG